MAATALTTVAVLGVAAAQTNPLCTTPTVLAGSNFEIDTGTAGANLKVDDPECIDWLNAAGTAFRSGVIWKFDTASGANDESFGQGTAEDNPNPTIVTGSIPPNKSDLKAFGVFTENDEFLELFWARVQNPKGTTNMDFELNQNFCEADGTNCANNGPNNDPDSIQTTPDRLTGDKLITYDLSKGGTVPTISIRTWDDTAEEWGPATLISGTQNPLAVGSINRDTIPASASGGLGQLDPFTFGEAAISFEALFGEGACGEFGSAYLKSRSSDSFTSEIKDFVPPEQVSIGNCPSAIETQATESVTLGSPISDTATLSLLPEGTTGSIEFNLYGPDDATCSNASIFTSTVDVLGNGDYNSGDFTPDATGTYRWTAVFTADPGQGVDDATSGCNEPNEASVVTTAPSTLETVQSFRPQDEATVTGAGTLGGTVTFNLYDSLTACQDGTGAVYGPDVQQVSGTGSVTVTTNNTTFDIDATNDAHYYWSVEYSGDATHDPASSACVEDTNIEIDYTTPEA
jgi:hypothetical protein